MVVVGALIVLVGVGAYMLQRVMRQQYLESHRYTLGEIAFYIAESGLNLTFENIRESTLVPGTVFYETLVAADYDQINGTTEPVEAPSIDKLLELFGSDAELRVEVEFREFQPFLPAEGLLGVAGDPREKFGVLAITSRATYRGVTRSIEASKQVKVVNITAPVLSKFTLFVRDRGGQEPNLLTYSPQDPGAGFRKDQEAASPLVFHHRQDRYPAVEGEGFLPLAPVLSGLAPDAGGLVFMGGADSWYLNLTHGLGTGPLEELFQLRRARYRMESDLPGVLHEYGMTFGFYEGLLDSAKFGSAASPAVYPRPGSTGDAVEPGTSALHLYGDVENVTPTIVLGPVFRSYVSLHLLDGLWYPYRTSGEFAAVEDTSRFRSSYQEYARVMARVQHEPYNRAYDYIVTNEEILEPSGLVTAEGTPFVPESYLTPDSLLRVQPAASGDENFLYPTPGEEATGLLHLARVSEDGTAIADLFRGALEDLDGPLLEELLVAKAVYGVEDAGEFFDRFLVDEVLDVPGIVWIQSGDLELDASVFRRGCMVLAAGGVTVRGAITPEDETDPVTLVALSGDLRIATSQTIQAHLIALRGQVTSQGRLDVQGALAAGSLDLENMVLGAEPKVITYDHDLDPTDGTRVRLNLRAYLDEREELVVRGH
jgi:hypothetical protein